MKANYILKLLMLSVLLFAAAVPYRASAQCSVTASNDTTITTGFGPQNCVVLNATPAGTSPFTYSWGNGATIANPTVCPASTTTYVVTVTDSNGCTATDVVTVFVTDVTCGRRKVTVCHIPAGDPQGAHTLCISENAVAAHIRHGDILGECPVAPPTCSIDLGSDIATCGGGPILIDAGPGFTSYLWTGGSTGQTFTATTSGTVTVIATDSAGCMAVDSVSISIFSAPTADAGADTSHAIGACDTLTGSASGGTAPYTFLWSTGDTTASITVCDTVTMDYILMVTDSNGCTDSDTITVTVTTDTDSCSIDLGPDLKVCGSGPIILDAGPGFNAYVWTGGSTGQTFAATVTGTYAVTAVDSAGCVASDSISIGFANGPTADAGPDTAHAIGECDTITGSASGGTPPYTFLWSTGDTTESITVCDTITMDYILMVTDSNGCTDADTITVSITPSPPACSIELGADTFTCGGDSIQLDAGPGFTSYLWTGGFTGQTLTITASGTYGVIATDSAGCIAADNIFVGIFSAPSADAGPDTSHAIGECDTITGSVSGGTPPYSFLWSTGDTTASITVCDTATMDYILMVTDSNGCMDFDTVTVTVTPSTADTCSIDLGGDITTCGGGPFLLDAGEGFNSYLWSDGSTGQGLIVTESGTFHVVAMDSTGCVATDTITISIFTAPSVGAGRDEAHPIFGCDTLNAVVSGGTPPFSFLWSTGETTDSIIVCDTANTEYIVMVTDSNGCTDADTIAVFIATCNVDLGPDTSTCAGGAILLDAGPGFASYLWQDSTKLQTYLATEPGTYSVVALAIDSGGCIASDSIFITIFENPVANAGVDTSHENPGCVTLEGSGSGGTPPYTFAWSTGDTSAAITVCDTVDTDYILVVTDSNGCTSTDTVTVLIISGGRQSLSGYIYNVPNPFIDKTRIKFGVYQKERVRVEILSLSGNVLEVLYDGEGDTSNARWIDFDSKQLAEGIYFARITSGNLPSVTHKMILMHRD